MGRGYLVEDAVERYLSELCGQHVGPLTGLLIGQSSAQRDFVVMATRTPNKQESAVTSGDFLDKEWVTEHARQVSRMLPGGLCVLGVFIITETDSKDTLTTLRQLVFAVENLISSERLWTPEDDDVTDCVTLHVNPKTRKTVCRTFDVKDPKSMAKPADWKYQSGVCSSWSMVSCCLNVDMLLPLPNNRTSTENIDVCVKEGLKVWADQIKSGFCLFDGKKLPEDTELTAGQKRNVRQKWSAQLLITPGERRQTDVIQQCGGSMSLRGTIHSRAYLHNNKPKAKLAAKLLKRDVISTVSTRVQMLLEELLTSEEESKSSRDTKQTEQFCLPRRIFCPVKATGLVCVCDYQFSDEGLCEMTERLKEMLDIDAAEEDLDTRQEMTAELSESNIKAGRESCWPWASCAVSHWEHKGAVGCHPCSFIFPSFFSLSWVLFSFISACICVVFTFMYLLHCLNHPNTSFSIACLSSRLPLVSFALECFLLASTSSQQASSKRPFLGHRTFLDVSHVSLSRTAS